MSARLQQYLNFRDSGDDRYRESLGDWYGNDAYMRGFYRGMIDELIVAIGERRVRALVAAMVDVDDAIAAKQKAAVDEASQ